MYNKIKLLVMLCCLYSGSILAQNIQLLMNQKPSPYLSDWQTQNETVRLIISNSSAKEIEVKIKTELFDGKGALIASIDASKMPVLTISATSTTTYNPEDIIPGRAINYYGNLEKTAITTGRIPDDNYRLCVSLIDPKSGKPIGTSGTVCKVFSIVAYQAPTLIAPANKEVIKGAAIKGIVFRWSPVIPSPKTIVTYRLQVWEVLKGQNSMTALRSNQPIVEKDLKGILQTQWPADFPLPDTGKKYVWTITPLDDQERKMVDGNGFSEPFEFRACCWPPPIPAPPIDPDIILISPANSEEVSENITFSWKDLAKVPNGGYTLRIIEIRSDQSDRIIEIKGDQSDIMMKENKLVFEQKGIMGASFKLGDSVGKLKEGEKYVWAVKREEVFSVPFGFTFKSSDDIKINSDDKKDSVNIEKKIQIYLPGSGIQLRTLVSSIPTMYACCGLAPTISWQTILHPGSGNYTWSITGLPCTLSGTYISTPLWWLGPIHSEIIPCSPCLSASGVYNCVLTITRGTYIETSTFIVNVYSPVSPGGVTTLVPSSICDGETSLITTTAPAITNGANIKWEYKDNCQPNWTPTTALSSTPFGIQGTPAGTNQQFPCPSSCTSPPWFTTREFRAHVGSEDVNAPVPCASTYTSIGTLKIYCKPSLSLSVSPTGPICNNGTSVTFTLTTTAVGDVTWIPTPEFTITGTGPTWTATGTPPSSGNIVFTAQASTGGTPPICAPVSQNVTILVDQPVSCGPITTNRDPLRIVCPPDDAELHLNCQNAGNIEWAYCKTPPGTGPWTTFGGNGMWQNTNSATENITVHTWYSAIVHSILGVCAPETLYVDIDVFPAPTPPVVSPAGPLVVCEGASTPLLTVLPPPGGFTYQWFHNGNPVSGPPSVWTLADAGNWWVVSSDNCDRSAISNIVRVRVEVINVVVGPCCGTNPARLFLVNATSNIFGTFIPTPGNIEWRVGNCNGAISPTSPNGLEVLNPVAGNTYCVRVRRNATSCWSVCKCFVTPKKCPEPRN